MEFMCKFFLSVVPAFKQLEGHSKNSNFHESWIVMIWHNNNNNISLAAQCQICGDNSAQVLQMEKMVMLILWKTKFAKVT